MKMTISVPESSLVTNIQHNCHISDAKDHGIYSMCTMVLKLRNLYKWEHTLEPWEEPETADLLDWIEAKETFWETISEESFKPLYINGQVLSSSDATAINTTLVKEGRIYGAGYGRSMKAVFYLADILEQKVVEGCPVIISGKELAKEMASPFAMSQEKVIYIRKEPLRFFLWDYIQELRSSCRISLRHALDYYGLLEDKKLNQERFKERLDHIVNKEMNLFVYHEVGEILETTFDSQTLQMLIAHYPGSVIEFVARALKDILADTHPKGVLSYIFREKRESSLSLYIGLLDGLRKKLFPEFFSAFENFLKEKDWQLIEEARLTCRDNNLRLAGKIKTITQSIGQKGDEEVQAEFNKQILLPLGLDIPKQSDK